MDLSTTPETPAAGSSARWVGAALPAHLREQPATGRRRRWVYAAAGDEQVVVGAAVVDVGLGGLGTAFAFALDDAGLHLWEPGPGRAGVLGGLDRWARLERRDAVVLLWPDGGLELDVPVDGGRLVARLSTGTTASPVSLVTPTPGGGWNATTKTAGHRLTGTVTTPAGSRDVADAGGWQDATDGRQDATTTWRWAAGAGRDEHGRAVGLQASTGMNGLGPGEDVVWFDGHPRSLEVARLDDRDGPWRLAGDGWSLELDTAGARVADEGLGPVSSRYRQPVGTWHGTLPGPDGVAVAVRLQGVAEDHEARW